LAKVEVSLTEKARLLQLIESKENIEIPFRTWVLRMEYLSANKTFDTYNIMTSSELSKPRFALCALQTARRNDLTKDASQFDHCDLKNIRMIINGKNYPAEEQNFKFPHQTVLLYDTYSRFQSAYYNKENAPFLSLEQFSTKWPVFVINSNRQIEGLETGSVDVKLYYESHTKMPADTILYSLMLCDSMVEYNAFNNDVRKIA
jgi:hypothetical protein